MKRLAVLVLAIAGVIGVVPTTTTALPPGVVPGPNSITGTVTDEAGTPLADIIVVESFFGSSTVTDADGTYLISGLPSGVELFAITFDQSGRFQQGESPRVIINSTAAAVADVVMHPFQVAGITGTVRDTHGTPLGGIRLTESQLGRQTTSAPDGTYAFELLRPELGVVISAVDPSGAHRDARAETGFIAADGSTILDLTMIEVVPAAAGIVTDPNGLPIEGADVSIVTFGISRVTDANGHFEFTEALPDGEFTLNIDPRNVRPDLRPTSLNITLVAGSTFDGSAQLSESSSIDVTVTAGGAPAEARVLVWSAMSFGGILVNGIVGTDGTVSLPILFDGDYYLQIESNSQDYASEFYPDTVVRSGAQRFSIVSGQHLEVAVDLERAASISGTITNSDGTPGDFTQVAPLPVGVPEDQIFAIPHCNLPAPDDPPGTYRVGCLHPSVDWVLKGFGNGVSDNGYYLDSQSSFNATPIAVEAGQAVTGIDFQLKPKSPNPTLTGLSQQYFITGTTTPGVRIFGTNFPTDIHAISITASMSAFFFPATVTVTGRVSSNELIATVQVPAGDIGPLPAVKELSISTSMGGGSDSAVALVIGDPSTPVATASGRVTDSRGRGVSGISVVVLSTTLDDFGGRRQTTATTLADGRWTAQGVSPGTYTVQFEGTEVFNSVFWKQRTAQTTATPITLANGDNRTGINATLTQRGPIKVFAASPKLQVPNLSFDLVGQGLGSIRGGFRVSIATPFGAVPLQAESVSSSRLHVTGFAFPGTWDIVTQWTANDGTVKSTTCVGCIKVYDNLSAFSFDNFIAPGNTATITYFGQGLVDITKVTVGGKDVRVLSYRTFDGGNIEITFAVKKGATLGSRPVTITRIDGRSTTTDVVVGSSF